jgi:hypothetical protein
MNNLSLNESHHVLAIADYDDFPGDQQRGNIFCLDEIGLLIHAGQQQTAAIANLQFDEKSARIGIDRS